MYKLLKVDESQQREFEEALLHFKEKGKPVLIIVDDISRLFLELPPKYNSSFTVI